MNKEIMKIYYKAIITAIIAITVIWISLAYFFLFAGKTPDPDLPQYLIYNVEEYVTISSNTISVESELKERLAKYDLWMQIINTKGEVVYQINTPEDIPQMYSTFDLLNVGLESDRIEGYTVFATEISKYQHYGVIIGCSSNLVRKVSYTSLGGIRDEMVKAAILFVLITLIIIVASSFYFTRNVARPVSVIMDDLDAINKNNYEKHLNGKGVFSKVFQTIAQLDEQLKENKRTREEWIANISHDIKTPLSSIRGYAELMSNEDYSFEKEEIVTYSKEIVYAEKIIEGLVGDLRISEKLEEGRFELHKENINLTELIKRCVKDVPQKQFGQSSVTYDLPEQLNYIGDVSLLKRSFQNLISNCFIHNDKQIHLIIKGYCEKNIVTISIADDGKGMSDEELKHIFDRYYRGTNTSMISGTGLGMAIAKSAVEAHGGTITVESKKNKGTKFIINI